MRLTHDKRRYNYVNNLIRSGHEYSLTNWDKWDYTMLNNIDVLRRPQRWDESKINDIIIMADTETSKKAPTQYQTLKDGTKKAITQPNHVVCWTITLRAYGYDIVTLRGRKPFDLAECISKIVEALPGDKTYIYIHNLSYDWVFIERFMFSKFGFPTDQLNTKPHYPVQIEFKNGLILRDSLILLQRSLEKVAQDLGVTHQKQTGAWDYEKIRHQCTPLSDTEWSYAEGDTLTGAECLEVFIKGLGKNIATLPLTATGIPRGDVRQIAKEHRWHDVFLKMALTFDQYVILSEYVYHGGYTHGNRHFVNTLMDGLTECYDFASSYPYTMLAFKFPMGKFTPIEDLTAKRILNNMEDYAFFFKLILVKPQLKSDEMPMPFLQFSKCTSTINPILDNGRIISAEYAEIWCTEYDLAIIADQYKCKEYYIREGQIAVKQYLPRWFTDYVFEQFKAKTMLKGGDLVLYALAKSRLNALYGMCVQRVLKDNIKECYEADEKYAVGDYKTEIIKNPAEQYETEINKTTSFLPYQWGVWVTAIATYNLFRLGKCVGLWLYSDTDSIYGQEWDKKKVEAYNEDCKRRIKANGYGPVTHNGREYWLGVAEHDGESDTYYEFKYMGAKRYAGRRCDDKEIHITVAGVPKKKGAKCLKSLDEFVPGLVFPGEVTEKKTHTYIYEDIYTDANGNECSNSVDLTQCDYKLDATDVYEWDDILEEEIEVITLEEE